MQVELLPAERQRLAAGAEGDLAHAEHLGVEADGRLHVAAGEHDVVDAVNCQHVCQAFGQRIICVQRNSAIGPAVDRDASPSRPRPASCLPRCAGFATQAIVPSRAVPRKLLFSSTVVKLSAPSGRCAKAAVAAGSVGQRNDRRRVQEAVGREELRRGCRARPPAAPARAPSRGSRRAPAAGRGRARSGRQRHSGRSDIHSLLRVRASAVARVERSETRGGAVASTSPGFAGAQPGLRTPVLVRVPRSPGSRSQGNRRRSQPLLDPGANRRERLRQGRRDRCRRPAPCRAARRPCRRPAARRG